MTEVRAPHPNSSLQQRQHFILSPQAPARRVLHLVTDSHYLLGGSCGCGRCGCAFIVRPEEGDYRPALCISLAFLCWWLSALCSARQRRWEMGNKSQDLGSRKRRPPVMAQSEQDCSPSPGRLLGILFQRMWSCLKPGSFPASALAVLQARSTSELLTVGV